MRCPDCNKFVSYGEVEPELNDVEINGTDVSATIRVPLTCADCGTELKECNFDLQQTIEHECEGELGPDESEGDDPTFSVEDEDVEGYDRLQTTDKKGKLIKNSRYMKKFYGANVRIACTCDRCNEEIVIEETFEEQASAFEELV